MEKKKIISISNLNVRYDETVALENVNLDIFADDFIGVIGPNGGGKSSLIKAILGLVKYRGNIVFSSEISRHQIGYMPQQHMFDRNFPMTVRDLIMSGMQSTIGTRNGYNSKNNRNYIRNLIDEFNISHLSHKHIKELSGGELQRILLCRAVINNPKLLILDEPTNFVDNDFETELYQHLKKLNEEMAIIMVSHDLGTISSTVKSIVCVNKTVHRHDTNILVPEMFENYRCPIQIISHGEIPHTVLAHHHNENRH